MQKKDEFETNPEVISFWRLKNQKWRRKNETEEFGVEAKAAVDSRIYERPSFFLGALFTIVFGGIGSKYESVFSIEYEGKTYSLNSNYELKLKLCIVLIYY